MSRVSGEITEENKTDPRIRVSSDSSKVLNCENCDDSSLKTEPNARIYRSEAGYSLENGEKGSDNDEKSDAYVYCESAL